MMINTNLLNLINKTLSKTYALSDFVPNVSSGSRAEGYFLDDEYYLKTNNRDYDNEKKAMIALEGRWYVPKLFLFDDETKSILMEKINGLSISNYVKENKDLPDNLIDVIYDIEKDMLQHNCEDYDGKLKELFWTNNGVKKVDYGQTEMYDQDNLKEFCKKRIKESEETKKAILDKEPDACNELKRMLIVNCGIPFDITEQFIQKL